MPYSISQSCRPCSSGKTVLLLFHREFFNESRDQPRPLSFEAVPDVRHRLNVVVKYAQLIEQGGYMLFNRSFHNRIPLGAYGVGDTSTRKRVVRPACQKEENAKLESLLGRALLDTK